ncbi:Hypothetical_protein [Hexamita inflata]|uniref:Hypothetical_protein n=1 Tax=Hexamita inflata TaxID=28002 RepID=A0AA86PLN6_9EUKA|nr:Hypothetical protein HINF_LOCUS25104 [Hexamita inflata]
MILTKRHLKFNVHKFELKQFGLFSYYIVELSVYVQCPAPFINKCVAVQTVIFQLTHCYQLGTLAVRRKHSRFNKSQVPQLFYNLRKISQLQSSSWTQCQKFDFDSIKEDSDFNFIFDLLLFHEPIRQLNYNIQDISSNKSKLNLTQRKFFILLKQQQHNDAVMAFELFKYSNMLVELGWFRTHLFLNYKKKLLQLYQSRTYGDSTELNTLLCLQKQLPPVLVCLAFLILKYILQKLTYLLNLQMTDEFEFTRKWTL